MSVEAQNASSVTPSYRRNGKLFSCEPCRKGKLRCDHGNPVCGRCARRNKSEQCIYHPAPLTKTRSSPSVGPQRASASAQMSYTGTTPYPDFRARPSPVTRPLSDNGGFQNGVFSGHAQASSVDPGRHSTHAMALTSHEDQRNPSSAYLSPESSNTPLREPRPGFLGPTSYSAVYTENHIAPDPTGETEDGSSLPPVSAEKIQQGADIFALLRDQSVFRRLTQRLFELTDGIVIMLPVLTTWVDELWAEWGPLLAEGRPDDLLALSRLVWRNTRSPFKPHARMTTKEWAKSASGKGLRWEVVGAILTVSGLTATSLSRWDSIFESMRDFRNDRSVFTERMRKAADYCQCFCYEAEVLNDLWLCFLFNNLILTETIKGDAHYAVWQRTCEMCDAIIALGIHRGNATDSETPFFLAELRKRIFMAVYGHDKSLATFLGRPPRLSHRYCKMEMPLDLSDDQLFNSGPEQDAIVASLDSNGWNTTGQLSRTTWGRVWFQHCRIREDILEISLGTGDEDANERADQVRARLNALHASFPSFMKLSTEDILGSASHPSNQALRSGFELGPGDNKLLNAIYWVCIHAGIVQTEFLLQRALINRWKTDTAQLIPVSRRLLAIVLMATTKRDFFRDCDMVYILSVHGLPAAGVLAIELLRQEQSQNYDSDLLPRSQTIQDLSVIVSALGTVGPDDGDAGICRQGQRSLKRVLDQILSPTSRPSQQTNFANPEQPLFDDLSFQFPLGNDADFFQWLDSFNGFNAV